MMAVLGHLPRPQPGEALSSLLLRLARNHAATAHELCALVWPGHEFWTRDIDRTASDVLLDAISNRTGWPNEMLRQATLRGLIEAMGFPERAQGSQDGILPLGIYHRLRHRFGQQFCPDCLAIKPSHLRLVWRLEFMVMCPAHRILLRDACPHCDAPFVPHRHQSLASGHCHRCGHALHEGPRRSTPQGAARLQRRIFAALAQGAEECAACLAPVNCENAAPLTLPRLRTTELLDGVRRLCRVLTCEGQNLCNRHLESGWARSRVAERAVVMSVVSRWLDHWPRSWIRWARSADLTSHYLCSAYGPWPEWVAATLTALPYSHGPTHIHRHRDSLSLRQLRRRSPTVQTYRDARARLLLRKAGLWVR